MTVLITAGEAQGMLLAPGGLDIGVDPVLVDDTALIIRMVVIELGHQLLEVLLAIFEVDVLDEVITTHQRALVEVLQSGLRGIVDGSLAVRTALGGHQDDTVTSLRTIDGGGGGVLQDLDGLDQGRIQILDAIHLQTVHDVERAKAGGGVGGITTDADGGAGTRGTVGDDADTGGLTLQGGGGIGRGTVHKVGLADGGDGTGKVALFLDAITDDHRFINEFRILDEDEAEIGLVANRNGLVGIADAGNVDVGASRDIETENTVHVSHGTNGSVADNDHGGSDDRSAAFIDNRSADGAVLGGSDRTQEARCNEHHSSGHFCKKLPCHKSVEFWLDNMV